MNREVLKDLLTFSKKEKNGIAFLVTMVVIVGIVQWCLPFFFQKKTIQIDIVHYFHDSTDKDFKEKARFTHSFEGAARPRYHEQNHFPKKEKVERWRRLGLPINEVDSTELTLIRGVGIYSARKIIKYRDALGGFIDTSQVRETYNLKPEICDSLLIHTCCFGENLRQIAINQAPDSVLGRHPYIGWKKAKIILAYIQKHGSFAQCSDLIKMRIWSEDEVEALCPYLKFSTE
jgi:DNA uptake protein ComE-like DNA-binding protein